MLEFGEAPLEDAIEGVVLAMTAFLFLPFVTFVLFVVTISALNMARTSGAVADLPRSHAVRMLKRHGELRGDDSPLTLDVHAGHFRVHLRDSVAP